MKLISMLTLLLLGALASQSALAWHHHHGGVRFGVFIGPPVFGPWWWYPPPPRVYYDPPVVYRQPVVVAAPPPVVVETTPSYSAPSAPANNGVIELGPAPGTPAQSNQTQPQSTVPAQPRVNPMPAQPQSQAPPQTQMPPQTQTAPQVLASQVYVYPRQGQSAQQQAQDEAECNRWASSRMGTGFDASQAAANFQRALAACLDAHGYSVR
jgi:hypothetical protein